MVKPIFNEGSWGDASFFSDFETSLGVVIDSPGSIVPDRKTIYLQIEPKELVNYDWVIKNYFKYDAIFCWEQDLLKLPNAILFPFGTCWINVNKEYAKEFGVSHLCSSKNQLPGHQLRYQVFETMNHFQHKKINHMSPPRIESKEFLFDGFMYSVIVENIIKPNWFTEKLIDCLASNTIPIYYGCPNIKKYFDDSYFLKFTNITEFQSILNLLTSDYYFSNIEKINKNKTEAIKYSHIWLRLNEELKKIYA